MQKYTFLAMIVLLFSNGYIFAQQVTPIFVNRGITKVFLTSQKKAIAQKKNINDIELQKIENKIGSQGAKILFSQLTADELSDIRLVESGPFFWFDISNFIDYERRKIFYVDNKFHTVQYANLVKLSDEDDHEYYDTEFIKVGFGLALKTGKPSNKEEVVDLFVKLLDYLGVKLLRSDIEDNSILSSREKIITSNDHLNFTVVSNNSLLEVSLDWPIDKFKIQSSLYTLTLRDLKPLLLRIYGNNLTSQFFAEFSSRSDIDFQDCQLLEYGKLAWVRARLKGSAIYLVVDNNRWVTVSDSKKIFEILLRNNPSALTDAQQVVDAFIQLGMGEVVCSIRYLNVLLNDTFRGQYGSRNNVMCTSENPIIDAWQPPRIIGEQLFFDQVSIEVTGEYERTVHLIRVCCNLKTALITMKEIVKLSSQVQHPPLDRLHRPT